MIGADVHKRTHTFVAVDSGGRQLGDKVVEATSAAHATALRWVRAAFGADVVWGIEHCRALSTRLLDAGQRVVRVPPRLTARHRALGRRRGKSDPIDAPAAAQAVLREPDLPVACHDEVSREMKLLTDRGEDLVGQRTATMNRLLGRVHELDAGSAPTTLRLVSTKHRVALGAWLSTQPGLVAELAGDELADVNRLSEAIDALTKRIRARVRAVAPVLLALPGCGALMAAKIVGEAAAITRFKSEAAFASVCGVAPVPGWSGNTVGRVYMTRSGNRPLNMALHRIAVTQLRLDCDGRAYYRKRLDSGDSAGNARRCLKRRLARVVYHRLKTDHRNRTGDTCGGAPS